MRNLQFQLENYAYFSKCKIGHNIRNIIPILNEFKKYPSAWKFSTHIVTREMIIKYYILLSNF